MRAECIPGTARFQGLGRRRVEAGFDGGAITSDAGLLLVREYALRTRFFERLAACFHDQRDPARLTHPLPALLAQRVCALIAGYEDLNDHDRLRADPLLGVVVGQPDPHHLLAAPATLSRLEHGTAAKTDRYHRITWDEADLARFLVDEAIACVDAPPPRIILDCDATDDPVHGHQEGRFFHGYYGHYCYLPLYIFWGDRPLLAKLRTADRDGCDGIVDELTWIVKRLREAWPGVEVWVRGDSGFAREALMVWCEANNVHFVLGLAKNARLEKLLAPEMTHAAERHVETGKAERVFKEFRYQTRDSWSVERRVVGKAEQLPGKANPRFVVTSLPASDFPAKELYEEQYAARGDMENRIKEQQLDLFADRTSMATLRGNQLRLTLSTLAYVLVSELRRVGLTGSELATAQAGTVRTRLIKLGGYLRVSARRVYLALASAFPLQEIFFAALQKIQDAFPLSAEA